MVKSKWQKKQLLGSLLPNQPKSLGSYFWPIKKNLCHMEDLNQHTKPKWSIKPHACNYFSDDNS
jgi:hypothetical protein